MASPEEYAKLFAAMSKFANVMKKGGYDLKDLFEKLSDDPDLLEKVGKVVAKPRFRFEVDYGQPLGELVTLVREQRHRVVEISGLVEKFYPDPVGVSGIVKVKGSELFNFTEVLNDRVIRVAMMTQGFKPANAREFLCWLIAYPDLEVGGPFRQKPVAALGAVCEQSWPDANSQMANGDHLQLVEGRLRPLAANFVYPAGIQFLGVPMEGGVR
ncbi:MAG: hypothetical protein WC268_00590 [Patescibacteria group bacterium]|jgi:hypothetical protein